MLVDGEWRTDAYQTTNEDGEFERQETSFRDTIGDEYPVESGRYHLYICRACPWAHGTAMVRSLLGLEEHVSLSLVEPERYNDGWEFSEEFPDPYHEFNYLREVYQLADEDFTGRVTVPVLYDKETSTIVNNESTEIMKMLNNEMSVLSDNDVDLYPDDIESQVLDVIEEIYEPINNGVYRAGFADTQEAYERAIEELFNALDHWDDILGNQRYLVGDRLTAADLRMFATLVRFDHVYNTHFKCSKQTIREYSNLWEYTKDVYQTEGIEKTVNIDHITRHYYRSHGDINPKRLVSANPRIDFNSPHGRDRFER
jgi:putative glutathione S-transferase